MTREEIDALPDTLTLTLKTPIQSGSETITELNFREPTAGQLEKISRTSGNVKASIELMAHSAGVLPSVIAGLSAREFKLVDQFLESFLQDARGTGQPA